MGWDGMGEERRRWDDAVGDGRGWGWAWACLLEVDEDSIRCHVDIEVRLLEVDGCAVVRRAVVHRHPPAQKGNESAEGAGEGRARRAREAGERGGVRCVSRRTHQRRAFHSFSPGSPKASIGPFWLSWCHLKPLFGLTISRSVARRSSCALTLQAAHAHGHEVSGARRDEPAADGADGADDGAGIGERAHQPASADATGL
jgi:hypothetical protein